MTKEEVLRAVRNHEGEVKTAMAALDYHLYALVHDFHGEVEGEIDGLKDMMSFVKAKADEIKTILGQWPS